MNYQELWQSLEPHYGTSEAKAITRTVLEVKFGLTLTDIVCGKVNELSANNSETLRKIFSRLLQGEPVQYVLGEADFDGHIFQVAPGILIPRPETEDLVEAVSRWWDGREKQLAGEAETGNLRLLDIGTGSGCIAVSLSLRHPQAKVTAWDISDSALAMARKNAEKLGSKHHRGATRRIAPTLRPRKMGCHREQPALYHLSGTSRDGSQCTGT